MEQGSDVVLLCGMVNGKRAHSSASLCPTERLPKRSSHFGRKSWRDIVCVGSKAAIQALIWPWESVVRTRVGCDMSRCSLNETA